MEEFDAMFTVEINHWSNCSCGTQRVAPNTGGSLADRGFTLGLARLLPNDPAQDSVRAMIGRFMNEDSAQADVNPACPGCNATQITIQESREILSAPEYLRVQIPAEDVTRQTFDDEGDMNPLPKRTDALIIDDPLDITHLQQDQSTPLQYRLRHVIRHSGPTVSSGHYVADVIGYGQKKYRVNDMNVSTNFPPNENWNDYFVTNPPQAGAFILVYEMIRPRARSY